MAIKTKITDLFNIQYPIVQGGMVWCSGYKLAAAVSNAGGLGLIGSGSMNPPMLEQHIIKCKQATNKPFGVNIPLLYAHAPLHIEMVLKHGVKIVFTSAGNPATYTQQLKDAGITVVHVIANTKFALKAQAAGVDALVAEGFEAGGHNGKEETTTFCLLPQIKQVTHLPIIAAGGMYNANSLVAAMALGADGMQIGSRFAACNESSAHELYKQAIYNSKEGDTILTLKEITPVRFLKNAFYNQVAQAYQLGADVETLKNLLGKGRAKLGIFEGNLQEGELEVGQISSLINKPESAADIVAEIAREYDMVLKNLIK